LKTKGDALIKIIDDYCLIYTDNHHNHIIFFRKIRADINRYIVEHLSGEELLKRKNDSKQDYKIAI
jgi:hypothetical protein